MSEMFRLLVAPGVTMDKWSRMWAERLPSIELHLVPADAVNSLSGQVDAGLVRLPVDQDMFHAIPLYTEATVVVVPKDHGLAAAEGAELTVADLEGETLQHPLDSVLTWPSLSPTDGPATTADAVELVAAGVGVLLVPQSLARLHHRRDLTYRVVTDAPTSSIGLAWPRDGHTDLVEEMIGIVRGRTANSTRGRTPAPAPVPAPKRPAARTKQPPRRRGR